MRSGSSLISAFVVSDSHASFRFSAANCIILVRTKCSRLFRKSIKICARLDAMKIWLCGWYMTYQMVGDRWDSSALAERDQTIDGFAPEFYAASIQFIRSVQSLRMGILLYLVSPVVRLRASGTWKRSHSALSIAQHTEINSECDAADRIWCESQPKSSHRRMKRGIGLDLSASL